VIPGIAADRIGALAESGGQPANRRPDRRGRGREGFAALDVRSHGSQAALEAAEHVAQESERVLGEARAVAM